MIKFVKNNRQKIIIAILTFVMIFSAIPFISLAEESNLNTTSIVTANVKTGKIQNSNDEVKTEISFTIHDPNGIKYVYWTWDRDFKPQSECDRDVIHVEGNPTEYSFSMPVSFADDDLGLHEFTIRVGNGENKFTNWKLFPYYVVNEKVPDDYEDKEQVQFYGVGEYGCPPSGSEIEPNRKFKLKLEDENDVFYFVQKWVKGTVPESSYKANATVTFKPGDIVEFYAPAEPGPYVLQFYAVDGANNDPEGHCYIYNVVDKEAPVLTLNEPDNNEVELNGTYTDPGAQWTDNVDGTGTVYSEDKVDTSIVGPQTIKYTITDSSGNTSEITRTVTVVGTEPSYKLVLPSKTEYMYGEDLDLSDAKLLYIDERGNTIKEETVTPDMFENFSTTDFTDISNITESKKATFKYGNQSIDYNYTVTQAVSQISISKNPTKTVYEYGEDLDLSDGKLSVVYQTGYSEIVDLSEATIENFDPNLIGNQTITLKYNNKDTYLNVTLNKRNVTITIDPVSSTYGEEIKTINYKLSQDSSLANDDSIDDLGIVASTTATSASNVGSYPIAITVSNTKYNVSIAGSSSYQIKPASIVDDDLTISAPTNLTYDGTAKTVIVNTNTNKTVNTEISYTGSNTTSGSAINAGDYTATVTITGTGNYTGSVTKSINFTIATKALTVTANDASSLYGAPIAANGYTITDSEGNVVTNIPLTVELTVNNVTDSSDAKTYEDAITAKVTAGNDDNNYNIIYVAGDYTINPAPLKASDVVVSDSNIFIYDGTAKTVSVNIKNEKSANIDIVYTGANVTDGKAINTGNYTANITVTGTGNYTGSIKKKVDLIINAKQLTVTANDVVADYGKEITTNGYTITDSEGNQITESDLTVQLTVDSSITSTTGIGTYTDVVNANVTAGNENNNYTITYVTGDYTINPAPLIDTDLTVAVPNDLVYNGSAKTVIINTNDNKSFNTEISYTGNNTTSGSAINAGDYTATVTITGTGNYTGSITKSVDFTISAKPLTVTANNASSLYGAPIAANGYTITDSEGNVVTNIPLTVELTVNNVTDSSDAKTYEDAITAKVTAGNDDNNYNITCVAGDYTINPAPLNDTDVTVEIPSNLIYDGSAKKVNVKVNNKTADVDIQYVGTNVVNNEAINVGNYTANITVTGTGNYTGTITKTVNFSISGNTLIITANKVSKEYGAPVEATEYTITDSKGNTIENPGLTIELIVDSSITSTSNIGTYTGAITVNVKAGNENNNYSITSVAGDYEITAATISESDVTFNIPGEPLDATYNGITYNGSAQTGSISITKYDHTLEENTDYTVSTTYSVYNSTINKYVELENGELPTEVGTYKVNFLINGNGNYIGKISKSKFYRIQPDTISEENISFNYPGEPLDATYYGVEYNGQPQTATVSISKNEKILKENKDYTLTAAYAIWDSAAGKYVQLEDGKFPTEVGAYRVIQTINGTGNYTGKISKTKFYKILVSTISEENVTFNFPGEVLDDTYNGVEYDPNGYTATVTIEKDNKSLVENEDYTLSITYSAWNGEIGKYVPMADGEIPTEMGAYRIAIIVRGTGNYNGATSKTRYLKIQQQQIKEEDIKITIPTDLEYDQNQKEISVEIINGKTATYTITYTGDNITDGKAINVGEYTATVKAKGTGDFGGEATKSVTFNIVDTTVPVITLTGDEEVTVEVKSEYIDAGATASDNYDGDITANIVTVNPVDVEKVGDYTVTYNVTDSNGNAATEVTRTVHVVDTTKPIITVDDKNNKYSMKAGSEIPTFNATATDNYDGEIKVIVTSNIDPDIPGTYTITFTATDKNNNTATVTREFTVINSIAPTITLDENNVYRMEVGESIPKLKATAMDIDDNEVEVTINTDDIDPTTVGKYKVIFTATDKNDNTETIEKEFYVVDTTIPVITRKGDEVVTVEVGSEYVDAGATASDNYNGDITANIVTVNPVNTKVVADYTVTYNVTDSSGNKAVEVTRIVKVVDTTLPVITRKGDEVVTVEVGSEYVDAGATAMDNYDGDITANIKTVNPVNTNVVADYTVTYNVTDNNGNAAVEVTRTVKVVDTTIPVITRKGDEVVTVEVGSEYVDAGATASDNYDGDITANIVTVNPVDVEKVGDYTVTYNVTDANGNAAVEVTRTVHVVDTTDPIITVDDKNNVYTMKAGSEIPTFNATATDNYDGEIKVIVTNNIKPDVPGTYTITFTATDKNNNTATETREFIVVEADKLIVDMTGYTLENKTTTYNATAQGIKLSKDGVETDTLPEGITNVKYEYTDSNNTTTTIAPTNAGTYQVKAIFTVDSKYNKVEDMISTLIINKADHNMSNVKFDSAEFIYDGTTSRSLVLDESTLPNGVTLVGYEGNGKVEIGTYTVTAKFAVTDETNYNVPANMTATLSIINDYVKSLQIDQIGNKTYKSGESITRSDILSIINITKVMASNTAINLTDTELANVQLTVDGKPLPVDTTPYAGSTVTITVSYESATADINVYVEGTTIQYLLAGLGTNFDNGTIFDTAVSLTWSSDEIGQMTYPDGHIDYNFTKNSTVSASGKYTIKVGNSIKTFEIIALTFNDIATVDTSTKTLTIKNIDLIESITISSTTYTKAEGNISNTFTLPRGNYTITIITTDGKKLESDPISIRR